MKLPCAPEHPIVARVLLPVKEYPEYQRAGSALNMLERYAVGDESFCYDYIFFGRHDSHDLSDPYASLYNSIQIRP